ncbi:MAG: hypothetical protein VKI42_08960 [Synechococcaceae cyanobacterium]|nr:hypothetical protein [Synechococcaceae cyanobacterium]
MASVQDNWDAIIEAHPLESHDPQAWLRYGTALLMTLEPGSEQHRQQQQAALAFMQARREGTGPEDVEQAQLNSVLLNLREALELADLKAP